MNDSGFLAALEREREKMNDSVFSRTRERDKMNDLIMWRKKMILATF